MGGKYFKAEVYGENLITTLVSYSIDSLRDKANPYMKNDKVTKIIVTECEDIGYFMFPKELEKYKHLYKGRML